MLWTMQKQNVSTSRSTSTSASTSTSTSTYTSTFVASSSILVVLYRYHAGCMVAVLYWLCCSGYYAGCMVAVLYWLQYYTGVVEVLHWLLCRCYIGCVLSMLCGLYCFSTILVVLPGYYNDCVVSVL